MWICNILQRCTAPRGAAYITAPLHICVRPLHQLLVLLTRAMREPLKAGRVTSTDSHAFSFYQQPESGESTGHDGLIMKQNKNEELQSRRQFFKKAAKATLPILGAIVLANTPMNVFADSVKTGCNSNCKLACATDCYTGCKGKCSDNCAQSCSTRNCTGGCKGGCEKGCGTYCKNNCANGNYA